MKRFFATNKDYSLTLLRVGAGVAMLPFGLLKLGLIAGPGGGFQETIQFMTASGIPWIIAVLVIIAENIGALCLILGFFTRFCAASLSVIMIGAVYFTLSMGYFAGFATPLLFVLMLLPLILSGGGAWSLDAIIHRKIP